MAKAMGSVEIYGVDELKDALAEIASETGSGVKEIRAAARKAAVRVVKPYLYESAGAEYTAKKGEIKKRAKITAKRASNLYGYALQVQANRLGLERFERKPKGVPKQAGKKVIKRKTVSTHPKRDGADKEMEGIFIARMKNKHVGLFRRTEKTATVPTKSGGVARKQKIEELVSLSLAEMARKTLKKADPKKTGMEDLKKAYLQVVRDAIEEAKQKQKAKEAAQ